MVMKRINRNIYVRKWADIFNLGFRKEMMEIREENGENREDWMDATERK